VTVGARSEPALRHALTWTPETDHELFGGLTGHAPWWPPTKVAGRYLSPYLAAIEDAEVLGTEAAPDGHPVELDLAH
jgi:hypothetical protein